MSSISWRGMAVRGLVALTLPLAIQGCGGSGGGGGNGAGGTGGGAPGFTAVDQASVRPSARTAARNSGPGDFAADFLRSKNFTSMEVEIDYPEGHPPSPAAVQLLEDRLAERCDKPGGVSVVLDEAIPASEFPPILSIGDLEDLEAAHRQTFSDLGTKMAAFYVLYVTGKSNLDGQVTEVLGLAYHGSSLALFVENTDPGLNPFVTATEIEGAGIVHETGHMLGLVNGGVPMVVPHEDVSHPGHDVDPACIMYWIINLGQGGPNIGDPGFAEFNLLCAQDMAAFGGKAALASMVRPQSVGTAAAVYPCGICAGPAGGAPSGDPGER
jgi:hypothetical protein